MMASHNNIKKNLDIINTLLGYNSSVPSDFPTIKNALLSNQRQIKDLFTQVTMAALSESTQAIISYLKTKNRSEILNHIQNRFKPLKENKRPYESISIIILTWIGIITILTLALWVVAKTNKKKCKSHYSLCHQEAKPEAMMTAYSTYIAEKTNQTNRRFQEFMEAPTKMEEEIKQMKHNQTFSPLLNSPLREPYRHPPTRPTSASPNALPWPRFNVSKNLSLSDKPY